MEEGTTAASASPLDKTKSSASTSHRSNDSAPSASKKEKRRSLATLTPSDPSVEAESAETDVPAGDNGATTQTKKRRDGTRPKKVRESHSRPDLQSDAQTGTTPSTKAPRREKSNATIESARDRSPPPRGTGKSKPGEKSPRREVVAPMPAAIPPTADPVVRKAMTPPAGRSSSSVTADSVDASLRSDGTPMSQSLGTIAATKPKLPGSRKVPSDAPQLIGPQPVIASPLALSASRASPTLPTGNKQSPLPTSTSVNALKPKLPIGPLLNGSRASPPGVSKAPMPVSRSLSPLLAAPGSSAPGARIFPQPAPTSPKPLLPGSRSLLPADAPVSPSRNTEVGISVRSGSGQEFVDNHNEQVPRGLSGLSLLSSSDSSGTLKMPAGPSPVATTMVTKTSTPTLNLPGSASIVALPSAPSPVVEVPVAVEEAQEPPTTITTTYGQQASFANRGYTEFPKRILDHHGFVAIVGGGNELSELPLALASRTSITRLEFPSNQFKEFPLVVTELPSLTYLDFSRNKIALLPPVISNMVSLKHLLLANNRLRAFPNHLVSLSSLQELDLSGNKLKTLPPQIGQMNSLMKLNLSSCEIDVLPLEIGLLGKLDTLKINHNGLNKIPNEFHSLYGLKTLDLGHNLFSATPSALFFANGLTDLNLEHNELNSVAEDIVRLSSLTRLSLDNNKLTSLPSEIALLTSLSKFTFSGNSLSSIPTEYQVDATAMLEYLTRIKLQSSWKRRKLVLVGEEFVGKTSLRMQLLNSCATKASKKKRKHRGTELQLNGASDELAAPVATDGIDIEDWEPVGTDEDGLEPITFSVWDFAGQQIYHPTHQFFITNRSMYLIIFNLLDERTSRVEYWLKTLRVRTDGKCSVVVVGTHADDKKCDAKHIETVFNSMKKKYSSRFPMVREYVAISSKTGKNLAKLTETLVALARSNASFRMIPDSYTKLEKTILQLRTHSSTLSLNDFSQVAVAAGVAKEDCVTCLEFFHDVGLVVYFNDKSGGLSDLVILDPLWIVNLLSSIITLKHSYAKDGIMMASCLPQIWREYPPSEYNWLLKLLDKFEITFRIVASATTGETTQDIRARWVRTLVDDMARPPGGSSLTLGNTMKSLTEGKEPLSSTSGAGASSGPDAAHPLLGSVGAGAGAGAGSSFAIPQLQIPAYVNKRSSMTARSPLQDMIVIPSLLPATPAEAHFNELWKDHSLFESHVSGRRYLFQFLPLGFFSRLIVRTLHMSGLSPQYIWRDGMIIDSDCERAMLIHNEFDYMLDIIVKTKKEGPNTARKREERRGSPERRPQQQSGGAPSTSPRNPGQARRGLTTAFTLLRQLSDCIETLLVSWFKLKVIVQVPCHHCLHEKLFIDPDWPTYHFPIEECMLAVREGQNSVTCHADRKTFKKKVLTGSVRGSLKGPNDRSSTHDTIFSLWAQSPRSGKDVNTSAVTSPVTSVPGSPLVVVAPTAQTPRGSLIEMPKGSRVSVGQVSPRMNTPPVPVSPPPTGSFASGGTTPTSATSASVGGGDQGEHVCMLKDLCPDIAFSDVSDMTVNYEDLNVGDVIGEGSYAELRTGTYNGEMVAVKVLKHQNNAEGGLSQQMDLLSDSFRELQHETFVMKNLKHSNLVDLKAICTHPLAMVVDYFPLGSLDRHLRDPKVEHPCLSWSYRVRLALNIAEGMDYLHSEDFMHRDLRSPNILIASRDENDEIVAKVADFGLAVICAKEFKGGDFNECWTAPEILKASAYNSKVDVYSFAIVMWELLELGHPFKEYENKYASLPRLDFFDAIIKGLRPSFPPDCPQDYIKLVNACWATEPEDRPTFDRIAEHLSDLLPLATIWDAGDLTASNENESRLRLRSGSISLRNLLRKKSKENNLLLRMQQQGKSSDSLLVRKAD